MRSNGVKFITRTAIILALAIVFQSMGRFIPLGSFNNFIVGPLVNACLIIAAATVGLWGAGVVSFATPFGAILTGAAIPLPFAPFIGVGNFLIVLGFYLLMKKSQVAGVLVGSLIKFGFLIAAITVFLNLANLPEKKSSLLFLSFSWPQLVTALIGGAIALVVLKALGKNAEIGLNNKY